MRENDSIRFGREEHTAASIDSATGSSLVSTHPRMGDPMNPVTIKIFKYPADPNPTHQLPDIPWFAGITALQAMIIGEAMYEKSFSFRVVYRSVFGALIDSIDGTDDDLTAGRFWMLYIDGEESSVGVSEAIISEDEVITSAVLEWRYVGAAEASLQVTLKTKNLPAI
jgi:hypothetical protein